MKIGVIGDGFRLVTVILGVFRSNAGNIQIDKSRNVGEAIDSAAARALESIAGCGLGRGLYLVALDQVDRRVEDDPIARLDAVARLDLLSEVARH
jgi:hypothetical protein